MGGKVASTKILVRLVAALVIIASAGCSKDSNYGTSPGGSTSTSGGAPNTVYMAGMAFSPLTLNVADSTDVTFRNNDTDIHTATANDASWDTGDIAPNSSRVVRFNKAGTFAYHCVRHPMMTASVHVQ
jgi:plastocyanin